MSFVSVRPLPSSRFDLIANASFSPHSGLCFYIASAVSVSSFQDAESRSFAQRRFILRPNSQGQHRCGLVAISQESHGMFPTFILFEAAVSSDCLNQHSDDFIIHLFSTAAQLTGMCR